MVLWSIDIKIHLLQCYSSNKLTWWTCFGFIIWTKFAIIMLVAHCHYAWAKRNKTNRKEEIL